MFRVSRAAALHLQDMLDGIRPKGVQTLRLMQKTPGRLGLAVDSERADDWHIRCADRLVLLIDARLANHLSEEMLIVEPGLDGQRLALAHLLPATDQELPVLDREL